MKRALGVVLLLSALSGCSSDPTPQDFERFAAQYAKDATREVTLSKGTKHNVTVTLKRHNLRKTDSLTAPFVGEAEYEVRIDGLTVRNRLFPEGKPGTYVNGLRLGFTWANERWQHEGGRNKITDVVIESLTPEQKKNMRPLHGDEDNPVTAEESERHDIWLFNSYATMPESAFRPTPVN